MLPHFITKQDNRNSLDRLSSLRKSDSLHNRSASQNDYTRSIALIDTKSKAKFEK